MVFVLLYPRGTAQNVLSSSSSKVMLRPCQRKSNCTQLHTSTSHLFGISACLRIVSHTEDQPPTGTLCRASAGKTVSLCVLVAFVLSRPVSSLLPGFRVTAWWRATWPSHKAASVYVSLWTVNQMHMLISMLPAWPFLFGVWRTGGAQMDPVVRNLMKECRSGAVID